MNSTLWIVIGIVVVLLLLVILLVVMGKKRGEAKKVSFEKSEEPKQLTQEQKSGNYQAQGGFNFAPAGSQQPASVPHPAQKVQPAQEQKPVQQTEREQPATTTDATKLAQTQLSDDTPEAQKPVDEPRPQASAESATTAAGNADEGPSTGAVTGAVAAGAAAAAAGVANAVPAAAHEENAEESADDKPTDAQPAEVEAAATDVEEPADAPVEAEEAETDGPAADAADKPADAAVAAEAVTERADVDAVETAEVSDVAEGAETADVAETAETAETAEATESAEVVASAEDIEESEEAEEAAEEAAVAAETQVDAAERALEETPVPTDVEAELAQAEARVEAGVPEQPIDDIAPAAGRLGKLRGRLSRSQNAIGQGLMGILSAGDLDDDAWEEIEDTLIMADLGTATTLKVTESLRSKIAERGVASEEEARAMLRETLIEVGHPEMDRSIKAMPNDGKPAVVMVVGVNGTGKTTTTGKLARVLVAMGHKVLLGAADTFRAAAADQLETWGRRVGATTVRGKEGADPASVAFDAVAKGVEQQVDVVLIDTAGRLHTSTDLMDQLGKVKRVVEKKTAVDEVLMVIDATVGQNGLMQARVFREVVDITGVVLTKLDGTAKGGIVFQVQEELGVPVKLVGLGEGADDLAPFEIEGFVDALLGGKA